MFSFGRRRRLLKNALQAVTAAQQTLDRTIDWTQADGAIIRYALKHGGNAELTVPDDKLRMLLSEQLAFVLIASENLIEALGQGRLFELRDIYPPLDPKDSEELVAKLWSNLWPDRSFPRLDR